MKYEPMQEDAGSGRVFQKASKIYRPEGTGQGKALIHRSSKGKERKF
jgi:hypothetical protein